MSVNMSFVSSSIAADRLPEGASQAVNGAAGTCRAGVVAPHGFGPMARISTAMGPVFAQTLREGDRVKTKSGEFLKIVAIKRVVLDSEFLNRHPEAMPITVHAGSFSRNVPSADMILAPNQKFHKSQALMGFTCENATDALKKPGVMRKAESMITYTTFHCGQPAAVLCEGMWLDTAP